MFLSERKVLEKKKEHSSRIQKLRGIIKVDENFDYKKALDEERMKRHIL